MRAGPGRAEASRRCLPGGGGETGGESFVEAGRASGVEGASRKDPGNGGGGGGQAGKDVRGREG